MKFISSGTKLNIISYMKRNQSSHGFTLIELLVVISIILIASSIIFIAGSGGDGPKLSSATRIVSGVAQGARGQAILKNADTLLLIHNDPTDPDKFRRFIGIVYEQSDDASTTVNEAGWVAATQGTYLPEGIYFDPELKSGNFGINSREVRVVLDYPLTRPQPSPEISSDSDESPGSYLFYRFNSNGTSANPNEWMVLRSGTLKSSGILREYDPEGEKAKLKSALIFRRVGTTTSVNDPTKIN